MIEYKYRRDGEKVIGNLRTNCTANDMKVALLCIGIFVERSAGGTQALEDSVKNIRANLLDKNVDERVDTLFEVLASVDEINEHNGCSIEIDKEKGFVVDASSTAFIALYILLLSINTFEDDREFNDFIEMQKEFIRDFDALSADCDSEDILDRVDYVFLALMHDMHSDE